MKSSIHKLLLFFLFFILHTYSTEAQEKVKYGFDLREFLKTSTPNQLVPILFEGKNDQLEETIIQYGGNLRLQIGNLYSIELPAQAIHQFSKEASVVTIEFSTVPGSCLSDTMLINTNVDSIIQKATPLRDNYTGKGVVLGVIDSGIELEHPDFQDSTGKTRVLYIWDQKAVHQPARKANQYNYGVEWTAADIDRNICTHEDDANEFGHGSNVTGIAASNGLATGQYRGVAPEVNIISVATDFNKANWLQTVVEAVDYIYAKADSLGMPCVINASIGTYLGSHDGKDIAARMIDTLIKQKNGRAFVCAAGNAGSISFHLQQNPQNDTVFTWFKSNAAQWSGLGGLYFELWADTNDFKHVQFSIGTDKVSNGKFKFRGRTAFDSINNRLNLIYEDSILNPQGLQIASVKTYAEQSQGRYKLEVAIIAPDSANYLFRLETVGTGKLDLWSSYSLFRHSQMINDNLPNSIQFPSIDHYQEPDSIQSMVSSFTCLPSVITVGNYVNRATFTDVSNTYRTLAVTPGEISVNSSLGPNRNNYLKPDISSAGGNTFAACRLATIQDAIQSNPSKVSQDSMHFRNGGTSMASPNVAGMVALYLQMCPQANHQQVKQDIINSVKSDGFTTNLPNNKWGYGKADGFQFIKKRVFTPQFTSPNQVCEGDTILLTGSNSTYSYHWNTNEKSRVINVSQSGVYYTIATNSYGCKSPSDTVNIIFNPLPTPPTIVQNGNNLSISEIGQYQWYFNQSPISQSTDSNLLAINSGHYYCIFTNQNNCTISSDTVSIIITNILEHQYSEIKLYPNPTSNFLNLDFKVSNSLSEIELYNLEGKLILKKNKASKKQHIQLDLSPFNKGIYFLKLISPEQIEQHKIILQ